MKTKITAMLLAAAILFSFAACGKTATDTTTSAATTSQTTVQTSGTTTALTTTAAETTQSQTDSRTGADTTAATTKTTTTAPVVKSFTKTELAKFDGKSGRDAYIAYDGIVYDVTNNKSWENGEHHGLLAGTDLTSKVNSCFKHVKSFMTAQFNSYPQVGTYNG